MEGLSHGSLGLVNAAFTKRLQAGGALVALGAALWVLHTVLIIDGLWAVLSVDSASAVMDAYRRLPSFAVFAEAAFVAASAAFSTGSGLLVYESAIRRLLKQAVGPGESLQAGREVFMLTRVTRLRSSARGGAAALIAYGVLGMAAGAAYFTLATMTWLGAISAGIHALLGLWIASSLVLVAGAVFALSFVDWFGEITGVTWASDAKGLPAGSIANGIGALLLVVVPLLLYVAAHIQPWGTYLLANVGVALEFVAILVIGTAVFGLLIYHAVASRKLIGTPVPESGPPRHP